MRAFKIGFHTWVSSTQTLDPRKQKNINERTRSPSKNISGKSAKAKTTSAFGLSSVGDRLLAELGRKEVIGIPSRRYESSSKTLLLRTVSPLRCTSQATEFRAVPAASHRRSGPKVDGSLFTLGAHETFCRVLRASL